MSYLLLIKSVNKFAQIINEIYSKQVDLSDVAYLPVVLLFQ